MTFSFSQLNTASPYVPHKVLEGLNATIALERRSSQDLPERIWVRTKPGDPSIRIVKNQFDTSEGVLATPYVLQLLRSKGVCVAAIVANRDPLEGDMDFIGMAIAGGNLFAVAEDDFQCFDMGGARRFEFAWLCIAAPKGFQ
jgi:hypothetical protein